MGVPGEVVEVHPSADGPTMGLVSFAGVVRDVCLMYVPDVVVGDHVIVHMGFAVDRIDAAAAQAIGDALREMEIAEAAGSGAVS
jgi:hydrogenase expression/formation protein HypC